MTDRGTEQITHFAIENWWLSDYGSFESQRPSQFFMQAIEASSLFYIDHLEQEALLLAVPQLERYFRKIFEKANAASQLRIKYLYDFSKEERYHHFSGSFPQFVQRIPQYMLASYLGFTPEYLSEIRNHKR